MFCKECGRNIQENNTCPFCGSIQKITDTQTFYLLSEYENRIEQKKGAKSKISAGVLQIFCGVIGLGRFYMGCNTYAAMQIAASVVTCGIGGVLWGIIDGIMILNGSVRYDGKGNLLV